jgi:hypothetical protein
MGILDEIKNLFSSKEAVTEQRKEAKMADEVKMSTEEVNEYMKKTMGFLPRIVAYCSPRCIIHVVPAINAGATTGEIFEAVSVGMIAGGFVPGGPGIPYAFEYALKCLDIDAKHRKGEDWEYLPQPKYDRGIY